MSKLSLCSSDYFLKHVFYFYLKKKIHIICLIVNSSISIFIVIHFELLIKYKYTHIILIIGFFVT